jgi:hypothetical protein
VTAGSFLSVDLGVKCNPIQARERRGLRKNEERQKFTPRQSSKFVETHLGSGMNNPDHISESLDAIFRVKILEFFDADPDP